MKVIRQLFKALLIILIGASMTACAADTPTKYWQEEVKLLDGRVIVVKQKLRYEGLTPRESWVTLKLPETGNMETTWNEKLRPRNLNVVKGKLYIVGEPQTDIEFYWYHKPRPPYIGYVYDNNTWRQIPFNEIPEAIYDVNLSFRIWDYNWPAPIAPGAVTLADKVKEYADPRMFEVYKRIDPSDRYPNDENLQADKNNKSLLSPNKIY